MNQQNLLKEKEMFYTINDHLGSDNPLKDKKFYNKIDAVDEAKRLGLSADHIFFHWFPSSWKQIDITAEPSEDYEELKKQRALKLRERYKYIKLFFSGGSDSITALNAFVKNGIHVDEIVNFNRGGNRHFTWVDPDNEVKLSARAYLESIKNLIPNTKITYKEMSGKDIIEYNKTLTLENKSFITFGETAEFDILPDQKILYLGSDLSTTCNLEGGQKPIIFMYGGEWYFGSFDIHNSGFNKFAEEFFFDPEDPRLFLKTVHRLKKFVEILYSTDKEKFNNLFVQQNKVENRKILLDIVGRDNVHHDVSLIKYKFPKHLNPRLKYKDHSLRYPFPRGFELVKSLSSDSDFQKIVARWFSSMEELGNHYSDFVRSKKDEPLPLFGFNPIYSRIYNLTTGKELMIAPVRNIDKNCISSKDITYTCLVI
jgi:hypothetical protein